MAHVVGLRLAWVFAGLLGVVVHDAGKCMGCDFAVVVYERKQASRPLRVVLTPAVVGMKLRQNLWIKQSASRLQACRNKSCQTKESSCSKLIAEGSACSVN